MTGENPYLSILTLNEMELNFPTKDRVSEWIKRNEESINRLKRKQTYMPPTITLFSKTHIDFEWKNDEKYSMKESRYEYNKAELRPKTFKKKTQ